MTALRLIISTILIVVSCEASGFGHILPAVRSYPIVRYAPFYNFPGVRSVHAVAPAVAPAPLLPAPLPAPVFPAPLPARILPGFSAPALPAVAPAPFLAPAPAFLNHVVPKIAPFPGPVITRAVSALPAVPFAPIVRPVSLPAPVPLFAPAPVVPAPLFAPAPVAPAPIFAPAPIAPAPLFAPAPAPIAVAKTLPYGFHQYANFAPVIKQAWK